LTSPARPEYLVSIGLLEFWRWQRCDITVYDVLSYLASGMTVNEILAEFPYLEPEDIRACLGYAAQREQHTLVAPQ